MIKLDFDLQHIQAIEFGAVPQAGASKWGKQEVDQTIKNTLQNMAQNTWSEIQCLSHTDPVSPYNPSQGLNGKNNLYLTIKHEMATTVKHLQSADEIRPDGNIFGHSKSPETVSWYFARFWDCQKGSL